MEEPDRPAAPPRPTSGAVQNQRTAAPEINVGGSGLNRADLAWATARVTCPTLMIATDDRGEWSPKECAETTSEMKDARAAVITGSRALPSLERPAELAALVTDFWEERPAGRRIGP